MDRELEQFRTRVFAARQVDPDRCDHTTACTIWGDDGQGGTIEGFPQPLPCNCGALQNWERKKRLEAERNWAYWREACIKKIERVQTLVERVEKLEQALKSLRSEELEGEPEHWGIKCITDHNAIIDEALKP